MRRSLCWFLLLAPFSVAGQEISVTSEVDRNRVTTGETLVLTITVSGSSLEDVPKPELPEMQSFIVIGNTSSSSTSFNLVNGNLTASRSVRFIYRLRPRETGTLVIGSAEINYGGTAHRTKPISIKVSEGASGASSSPGGSPNRPAGPSQQEATLPDLDEMVYIRATLDKKRAHIGEQVTVTYTLYTRLGLSNARYEEVPSYTGFWLEDLFTAQHLDFQEEIIAGKRYAIAKLRQIALFPTVTGELKIAPLVMICDVQGERSRRSLIDRFLSDPLDTFFSTTRQIRVASAEQTVTVVPLPERGRPDGFSNAVGDFSLKAMVDQTTTEVNQPVTLTIVLSGEGNLKTVADPVLPELDFFKEYQSGNRAEYASGGSRISGTKTWEHVLIPTHPGEHAVASLALSFFNPDVDAYRVAKTDALTITVLPPSEGQVAVVDVPQKTIVRQIREDIQYIKPETVFLGDQGEVLYRSTWYLLLHILPVAAILATVLYRSHAHRLRSDAGYARRRRAKSNALDALGQSKAQLDQGALGQTFTGISNALYGYVADLFNLPTAGLTSPNVVERLREGGVNEGAASLVKDCLDACDLARFAPTALTAEHAEDVLDKARSGIESIELQMAKDR